MGDAAFTLATQVEQIVGNSRTETENLEQLAPLVRNACVDGTEQTLVAELEQLALAKESEIERICNDNHAAFVHSVDRLLDVRKGTDGLRRQVAALDAEIQGSGSELAGVKKGLIDARAVARNIGEAVETLERCLRVLNMTHRVREYVDERNFYAALRALADLEDVELQSAGIARFAFVATVADSIPSIRRMIQDAVMAQLKAWLFDIREKGRAVGRAAFEDTARRKERWRRQVERNATLQFARLNSSIELVLNEENDFDALDNDAVAVDFTTLFECMHLFAAIEDGGAATFRRLYANDRRTQRDLLLSTTTTTTTTTGDGGGDVVLAGLERLLWDVTGFAIIEHFTLHKAPPGFRTQEEVDAVWDATTDALVAALSTTFGRLEEDPAGILAMRDRLVLFVQTLEGLDFQMRRLDAFMLHLFEGYADALKRRFAATFRGIADEDVYLPMSVDTPEDWEKIAAYCWYRTDEDPHAMSFPAVFPFSQIYPLCCIEVRNFINEFYLYADDERTRTDDVEDLLRRSLDDILVKCVNSTLASRLPRQRLEQVVQMIVNLENFEGACVELNKLLNESRSSNRSSLLASEQFGVTSKAAEKRIFELVDRKIDEFLEFAEYDWATSAYRREPAPYVSEMVTFLRTTIDEKLMHLPLQIKGFVYFDALDHLADQLGRILAAPGVRKITDAAVANFDEDIRYLERFILSLDDPVLEGSDTLGEIRQSLNLLRAPDVSEYLDAGVRNRQYPRIRPAQAITLLEKLLNAQGHGLAALDQGRRTRKATIEYTLNHLKSGGRSIST